MAKGSAKKIVKKVVKKDIKPVAGAKPKSDSTPDKKVEKILEAGLDSQIEYAYEDDSKSRPDSKSKKSGKPGAEKPKPKVVAKGLLVAVEYVGKLKSGEEFDNSKNHGPIQFIVGNGQVIPGFDKAVLGMKVGDKKKFTIPKTEAYGDVNPSLVQIVSLNKIPENIRSQLKAGGYLVMQSPVGQQVPVKIVKLDNENVHLDMNHPLAGQDLMFEIKVVDINHAPEQGECCGCDDSNCGPECNHEHK